ncbi:hypothetical protein BTJ40_05105 [Microbulbifer sp. A4B17]|nr:hypothetical protein BTJ40_05105 [Microbulbifer sp. A4B17]
MALVEIIERREVAARVGVSSLLGDRVNVLITGSSGAYRKLTGAWLSRAKSISLLSTTMYLSSIFKIFTTKWAVSYKEVMRAHL